MHILRRMHAKISEHLPELRRRVGAAPARENSGPTCFSITAKSMSSSSPDNKAIHAALDKATAEKDLTRPEAESAMEEILSGRANDILLAALLTALHMKGETVDELVGFATAMRRHATPIFAPGYKRPAAEMIVDTCGTGGDASGTFNISTAAAFVVAGAGVKVAKHGNRSISSRCGSADVLEELGARIDLPAERVARSIEKIGIGFLFAPAIH